MFQAVISDGGAIDENDDWKVSMLFCVVHLFIAIMCKFKLFFPIVKFRQKTFIDQVLRGAISAQQREERLVNAAFAAPLSAPPAVSFGAFFKE